MDINETAFSEAVQFAGPHGPDAHVWARKVVGRYQATCNHTNAGAGYALVLCTNFAGRDYYATVPTEQTAIWSRESSEREEVRRRALAMAGGVGYSSVTVA